MTLRYIGHWDPGTLRLLEYRTLGPLPILLHHLLIINSYGVVWYGLVWFGGVGGCQITSEFIHEEISMFSAQKSFMGGGWVTLQL